MNGHDHIIENVPSSAAAPYSTWKVMTHAGLVRAVTYTELDAKIIKRALDGAEDGLALIAAERQRQITAEGWTPEHDAGHGDGELARAAGCYALVAGMPSDMRDDVLRGDRDWPPSPPWPWEREWWKPGADNSTESRIRELAKAGALTAAEIDRLLRATGDQP